MRCYRVISGITDFVCLCVCAYVRAPKEKWLELSTPNLIHILYARTLICIDPEVKGAKVKVAGLWSVLPAGRGCSCWNDCFNFCSLFIRQSCVDTVCYCSVGALHDGNVDNECSSDDQFLMAINPQTLSQSNFDNAFRFSHCSERYFARYISRLNKWVSRLFRRSSSDNL